MTYQSFTIAPFGTGLDTDQEPWALPVDSFTEIENGHIHHGYVEKRSGNRLLTEMVHGRDITAATAANPAVFTVSSATGLANGDEVTLHYLAGGTWANLNELKYTVSGLSGATFNLVDSSGTTVDGSGLGAYTAGTGRLGTFEALRIMGIFRFIDSSNTRQTLIADTERVSLYNPATGLVDPLDVQDTVPTIYKNADIFTPGDLNYIWSANWQHAGAKNRVYFTNGVAYSGSAPGVDGLYYYDASAAQVEQFHPALSGSNEVYGSKLIFSIKNRLLLLHTFEYNGASTSAFPQRARWCAAQDPSNWDDSVAGGGGFVDAPTGDHIISARQLQDLIIVQFTDSVWTLRPVSDPALPFRWDKINDFRACGAKMATVGYDRYVLGVGSRGITATDGVETRRVDQRIEDFTSEEVNQDEFGKVFIERDYQNRRTWFLYPSVESDDADAVLIYDDESGAYSKYLSDINVVGRSIVSQDFAAQDFIAANNLDVSAEDLGEETALSFFWSKNTEIFLGGDRTGKIYELNFGNTDNGSSIDLSLTSAGWNPFTEQGQQAQFGYIDFYLNSDQETFINIFFYKNDDEEPYKSQSLNLLPNLNYRSNVAQITPNADPSTGFTITSNNHGFSSGDNFYMYGVLGAEFYNDLEFAAGPSTTENVISSTTDITTYGKAITGITQANPAVVTSAGHDFVDGDIVTIVNVSGMTEVNGLQFTVANSAENTFELSGINSSAYTAYSSGGYIFYAYKNAGQTFERKFYRTKVWKRAYAGGIGYTHRIKMVIENNNKPFRVHAFRPWFKPAGRTLG